MRNGTAARSRPRRNQPFERRSEVAQVQRFDQSSVTQGPPCAFRGGGPDLVVPCGESCEAVELSPTIDPVEQRHAVSRVSLEAELGELQIAKKGGQDIPIPGGRGIPEGVINVVNTSNGNNTLYPSTPIGSVVNGSTGLSDEGYVIRYGSSIVMSIELTADGPSAKAVLTYSQSSDTSSPHSSACSCSRAPTHSTAVRTRSSATRSRNEHSACRANPGRPEDDEDEPHRSPSARGSQPPARQDGRRDGRGRHRNRVCRCQALYRRGRPPLDQ